MAFAYLECLVLLITLCPLVHRRYVKDEVRPHSLVLIDELGKGTQATLLTSPFAISVSCAWLSR
jgi:hypothetical protein